MELLARRNIVVRAELIKTLFDYISLGLRVIIAEMSSELSGENVDLSQELAELEAQGSKMEAELMSFQESATEEEKQLIIKLMTELHKTVSVDFKVVIEKELQKMTT